MCMCCVQELRDRNDELSSELELLKSQKRKWRRASGGDAAVLDLTPAEAPADLESDSGKPWLHACVSFWTV